MSYQVLARKWRPKNFHQLVGQEHVKQALIGALDAGRLHHAFLFTGTRGVGKTTIARILSRCLNCLEGVSSKPCGECDACLAIDEGRFVDLIEVDAASKTKVDDTRELLENVQYRPTQGRYKVYLIDEVHMLSSHSFNALLKTLEEPPPHVVFLLATTDPQKLPVTVLSRCLQFHLRHMSEDEIAGHLQHVLTAEAITFEPAALVRLAQSAAGSMRDGLSLLDQAIAYGGGQVAESAVKSMLGAVERPPIWALLAAIHAGDAAATFAQLDQFACFSNDFAPVLDELLHALHEVALAQQLPDFAQGLDTQGQALVKQIPAEDLQLMYEIALHGRRDLPLAPSSRLGFEMLLLRQLAFRPVTVSLETESAAVATKASPLQAQPAQKKTPEIAVHSGHSEPAPGVTKVEPETPPTVPKRVTPVASTAESLARSPASEPESPVVATSLIRGDKLNGENWASFAQVLPLPGMAQQVILNSRFVSFKEDELTLACSGLPQQAFSPKRQDAIRQSLSIALGRPPQAAPLRLNFVAQGGVGETASERQQRLQIARQNIAEETVNADPVVQELLGKFDARVRPGTIKPIKTGR